tara:strand:+ start:2684 stop:3112 length:429 start_codon:yes stop_codon:yes gene_type:complete
MVTRSVRTEVELAMLVATLKARKRPFSVDIIDGRRRSTKQNALQHKWMAECAEALGYTPLEHRAYCKLHFGVPLLRAESEPFRIEYDAIIKPLPYEHKLRLMGAMEFPVTRRMNVDQKTRYLDAVYQHFVELGVMLTIPEAA